MINKDFFKKIRILDGGMGQELLARGMKPNSTLWSANAILDANYHQLVLDTHVDFIKAGAEVIVTTTFATRQKRLKENSLLDKFEYLNQKAGELAQAAKQKFPNTYIAGGIPPQNLTYEADDRDEIEIIENFHSQAKTLNPYVDFFYFDVWSSIKEVKCGIDAVKEFKKPYLVGLHISEGTTLPSGEKIKDIKNIIDENALGVMLSCVSPENFEKNLEELRSLNIPFGFKLNGFVTTKLKQSYTTVFLGKKSNPNEILGKRQDLTPTRIQEIAKKFKDAGATILGGCCETNPSHIEAIAKIK
jgi:homocysteine S-methyltransferase